MSYHLRRYQGSKNWYYRITYPDGSRGNWLSTRQSKKAQARIVAERYDALAAAGQEAVTLEQAFQLLAQHMLRKKDSDKTMEILELKARQVCRVLGHERVIATLTLADTERYLDVRRAEGRSDSTIANELGKLRAALRRCAKLDLYNGNIEKLWPEALAKSFKGKTRWLQFVEYSAILETIFPKWRDHLIIYVQTGIRYSELYRLTTADVVHGGKILIVRGTKTTGAIRRIPLSEAAQEALRRRASMSVTGQLFELESPDIDSQKRAWLRALAKACKRAGRAHASTNDLRRTFASWCWHLDIDEEAVIRWMGHGSEKMVRTVYQQPSDDHYLREIGKFRLPTDEQPPLLN